VEKNPKHMREIERGKEMEREQGERRSLRGFYVYERGGHGFI
jgi:hypothetical protein